MPPIWRGNFGQFGRHQSQSGSTGAHKVRAETVVQSIICILNITSNTTSGSPPQSLCVLRSSAGCLTRAISEQAAGRLQLTGPRQTNTQRRLETRANV